MTSLTTIFNEIAHCHSPSKKIDGYSTDEVLRADLHCVYAVRAALPPSIRHDHWVDPPQTEIGRLSSNYTKVHVSAGEVQF